MRDSVSAEAGIPPGGVFSNSLGHLRVIYVKQTFNFLFS
jgi:hypothetical protein